jgi:hypothetical protein
MGVAGSATVSAGSFEFITASRDPHSRYATNADRNSGSPGSPISSAQSSSRFTTAAAAPPKYFSRSDAPAWSRGRRGSRCRLAILPAPRPQVRRHVAKQRPQQLVGGHALVELHHQGVQHLHSTQPLIQRGNLIFFFGHAIHFPCFASALFYRHPYRHPGTWPPRLFRGG